MVQSDSQAKGVWTIPSIALDLPLAIVERSALQAVAHSRGLVFLEMIEFHRSFF